MHALFEELFINSEEAELQTDEQRRRARRSRRNRSRTLMTVRSRSTAPVLRRSSG